MREVRIQTVKSRGHLNNSLSIPYVVYVSFMRTRRPFAFGVDAFYILLLPVFRDSRMCENRAELVDEN